MAVTENYAVILSSEADTLNLGADFASNITAPLIIWLQGDLGAGKTTFTRGLLNALGHHGAVKSPTYNIVECYFFQAFSVNHFDLYRFQTPDEWMDAGLDELITTNSISLIEWPQLGKDFVPQPDMILNIKTIPVGRQAQLVAVTDHGKQNLDSIIK
jgi:tRNA threonylcarbamoyladenosine biosynthesis protein TsaE